MRTWILAYPIAQKSSCCLQLIQCWMSIFLTKKMGKRLVKNSVNCFYESWNFLNPLSVWDNDDKIAWVELPAGKHGLFVGATLRSGPHLAGASSWAERWAGEDWEAGGREGMVTRGWNSLDKGSALTRVGYCSREALNCETSLCAVVGVGIVTKHRQRGTCSSLCYAQHGKNQLWKRLTSPEI